MSVAGSSEPEGVDGEDFGGNSSRRSADVEHAVLGVLYTLSKEQKKVSYRYALLTIVVDFVQLSSFCITIPHVPASMEWIELREIFLNAGFHVYRTSFWLFSTLLLFNLLICGYVAYCFRMDRFPYVWPIRVLRNVLSVFFSLLYVTTLNFFLLVLDCKEGVAPNTFYHLAFDAELRCWEGGVLLMQVVAIFLGISYTIIAALLAMAKFDLDPVHKNPLGAVDSGPSIRVFVASTLMTLLSTFMRRNATFLSLVICAATAEMVRQHIMFQPFYDARINALRTATLAGLCAGAIARFAGVLAHGDKLHPNVGWASAAVVPAAVIAAYAASLWRLRRVQRAHALERQNPPDYTDEERGSRALPGPTFTLRGGEFGYPAEVELCTRFLYTIDTREEELDLESLQRADTVFKAGIVQFPDSVAIKLAYSNYLLHYANNAAGAHAQIAEAKHLRPALHHRFMIFIRDMERTKRQRAHTFGQGAMDLVAYVEFQSQLRRAVHTHKKAFRGMRSFWRHIAQGSSGMDMASLGKMLRSLDKHELVAESTYISLLKKYPKSVKLLRAYGVFQMEIKNSPEAAERYFAKADQLEDDQAQVREDDAQGGGGGAAGAMLVPASSKQALVVIDRKGRIKSASAELRKMFGYTKEELVNRNVSMLMPSPYKQQHNEYLERYLRTRRPKVIGSKRRVECVHKQGHLFLAELAVTEVASVTSDTAPAYAAVMTPVNEADMDGLVTVSMQGIVMTSNRRFLDMMGYTADEIYGKNIAIIMVDEDATSHNRYIERFRARDTSETVVKRLRRIAKKKNGLEFPINLTVTTQGKGADMVLQGHIEDMSEEIGMLAITERGVIHSVNNAGVRLFGYQEPAEMLGRNINIIMPEPFRTFHNSYLHAYITTGRRNVLGTTGRTVPAVHKDGTVFSMHLEVSEIRDDSAGRLFVGKCSLEGGAVVAVERHAEVAISREGIITATSPGFERLLGFADAVGQNISIIMPDAIAVQHDAFLARYAGQAKSSVTGHGGRMLFGQHRDGTLFPLMLKVEEQPSVSGTGFKGTMVAIKDLQGVLRATADGTITSLNPEGCMLFGYFREQLVGQKVSKLAAPSPDAPDADADAIMAAYRQAIAKGVSASAARITGLHRDGSAMPLFLELVACKLEDGKPGMVARLLPTLVREDHGVDAADLERLLAAVARTDAAGGSGSAAAGGGDDSGSTADSAAAAGHTHRDEGESADEGNSMDAGGSPQQRRRRVKRVVSRRVPPRGMSPDDDHESDAGSHHDGDSDGDHNDSASGFGDDGTLFEGGDDASSLGGGGSGGKRRGKGARVIRRLIKGTYIRAVFSRVARVTTAAFVLTAAVALADLISVSLSETGESSHAMRLFRAGRLGTSLLDVAADALVLEDSHGADRLAAPRADTALRLRAAAEDVEVGRAALILEDTSLGAALQDVYIRPRWTLEEYFDTAPPQYRPVTYSMWRLLGEVVHAGGVIADRALFAQAVPVVRETRFVVDTEPDVTAAMEEALRAELDATLAALDLLMLLQLLAVGVQTAILFALPLLLYSGIVTIFRHRDLLFFVFMDLPKQAIKRLAERKSEAQADSDESGSDSSLSDSSDEERTPAPGRPPRNSARRSDGGTPQPAVARSLSRGDRQPSIELISASRQGSLQLSDGGTDGRGSVTPVGLEHAAAAGPGSLRMTARIVPIDTAGDVDAATPEVGPKGRTGAHWAPNVPDSATERSRAHWLQLQQRRREEKEPARHSFIYWCVCFPCLSGSKRRQAALQPVLRRARIAYFLAGCLVCVAALLSGGAVARYSTTMSAEHPIRDVFATAACMHHVARLRVLGAGLVLTDYTDAQAAELRALPVPHTALGREQLRRAMEGEARRVHRLHEALVYGDAALGMAGSASRAPQQRVLYFGRGCLRANASACYPPAHPFHRATSRGLSTALMELENAALRLANDSTADLTRANLRFQYLWEVGLADVRDGLRQSLAGLVDEANSSTSAVITLVVTTSLCYLVALVASFQWLFKPFLFRIQTESTRAATMLSFLPPRVLISKLKAMSKKLRVMGAE